MLKMCHFVCDDYSVYKFLFLYWITEIEYTFSDYILIYLLVSVHTLGHISDN